MINRPIKLRFWDKEYSCWRELPDLYGNYTMGAFRTYGAGFDIKNLLHSEAHQKINDGILIVQQFTGLLDSTGKEIYEGDLLLGKDECGDIVLPVAYEDKYGAFTMGGCALWKDWLGETRIVGNLFETPELLK